MKPDEEHFAQVLKGVRPRLKMLLASYLVPPQDYEDLLQEAFLALWCKRLEIDDPEAWLLSAVRMECLRYRRRKARQVHIGVEKPVLESLAGQSKADLHLRHDLRASIRALPARHRALLQLRYGLGLTPEETAGLLGYRLSSLKKTTTRCLQSLRSRLS